MATVKDAPPSVHEAWSAVMGTVQGIRKGELAQAGPARFNFRGIDAVPERIWSKLVVTSNGCWEWTGASTLGYGRVHWGERSSSKLVHRVVFALATGREAPEVLDHLCRNTLCCNPAHLDPVSQAENIRRGNWGANSAALQRAKTHCPNGHEFTTENTYIPPSTSPKQRQCRTCRLATKRRYNEKMRDSRK